MDREKIKKSWKEFMQEEYPYEYGEGEPIPEEGVMQFCSRIIQECLKDVEKEIETFEKSFIKTIDDKKDENYNQAKKTEDEIMISNLSGEVNVLFWMRKELIERINELKTKLLKGEK